MSARPAFFEPIRRRASQRWDQLENDPELAAPWHQLFRQIQSPSHVLSELLQNADDAGATEAWARIEGDVFIFEHNGEDFTEEHFASLCQFGYSNKRILHTIGFRGIGFKSIFSLGDGVELYTPTLSIAFDKQRFTEPKWTDQDHRTSRLTRIQVSISDNHRKGELQKNLQQWLKSPVSLLFFGHIRRMTIADRLMHWRSLGPGPVPGSVWMALDEKPDEVFLLACSDREAFPEDALTEIRQERMISVEEAATFPPCTVEIVLGAAGRLFVVLPSGVETELPFACNAPFIQDPARFKIKDPEISPTNRRLLERVGGLAASVMLGSLGQSELDPAERAQAYNVFPDVDREDSSLEGSCGATVEKAFERALELAENEAVRRRVEKASICAYRAAIEPIWYVADADSPVGGGPPEWYGDLVPGDVDPALAERMRPLVQRFIELCRKYEVTFTHGTSSGYTFDHAATRLRRAVGLE